MKYIDEIKELENLVKANHKKANKILELEMSSKTMETYLNKLLKTKQMNWVS